MSALRRVAATRLRSTFSGLVAAGSSPNAAAARAIRELAGSSRLNTTSGSGVARLGIDDPSGISGNDVVNGPDASEIASKPAHPGGQCEEVCIGPQVGGSVPVDSELPRPSDDALERSDYEGDQSALDGSSLPPAVADDGPGGIVDGVDGALASRTTDGGRALEVLAEEGEETAPGVGEAPVAIQASSSMDISSRIGEALAEEEIAPVVGEPPADVQASSVVDNSRTVEARVEKEEAEEIAHVVGEPPAAVQASSATDSSGSVEAQTEDKIAPIAGEPPTGVHASSAVESSRIGAEWTEEEIAPGIGGTPEASSVQKCPEAPRSRGRKRSRQPDPVEAVDMEHLSVASTRPVRQRMRPLECWRNERVIYERKPGSLLPTVAAVESPLLQSPPERRAPRTRMASRPEAGDRRKEALASELAGGEDVATPEVGKKAGRASGRRSTGKASPADQTGRGRKTSKGSLKADLVAAGQGLADEGKDIVQAEALPGVTGTRTSGQKRARSVETDKATLKANGVGADAASSAKLTSEKPGRRTGAVQSKVPKTPDASKRALKGHGKASNSAELETPRVMKRIAPTIPVPARTKDSALVGDSIWGPATVLPRAARASGHAAAARAPAAPKAQEASAGKAAPVSLGVEPRRGAQQLPPPVAPPLPSSKASRNEAVDLKESAARCPRAQQAPPRTPTAGGSLMAAIEAVRMQQQAQPLESGDRRQQSASRGLLRWGS